MMYFQSRNEVLSLLHDLPGSNAECERQAAERQGQLTKPLGSLGKLEELAVFLAGWQGVAVPHLNKVDVLIFAGSHGITAQGVSAYPAEVTEQMVANFKAGGAAINQLAAQAGATLQIIPLSVERATQDFTSAPAMDEEEFLSAISTGFLAVAPHSNLICLGEMGIGNTTVAAAMAAALFGGDGASWVGRGTGIDNEGLHRKAKVVDDALAAHGSALNDPLEALRCVGGREIAAIFGATLAARMHKIPVILDGFVCTAAAAPLAKLSPDGFAHVLSGHVSAEAQHGKLLNLLGLTPLLNLEMRLGEGSGACLAINLLRSAVTCHANMATFAQAGVSKT